MSILKKGDKVGIVSPSGYLWTKDYIDPGVKHLVELGLVPVFAEHVYDRFRYMAGTPLARAEDLMKFYKDPEIKAIFATRGGAGAQYILPLLDYKVIKNNPKPLFGFSDITSLHMGIYAKTNVAGYSGFLLGFNFKDGKIFAKTKKSLDAIIKGEKLELKSGKCVIEGKAKGKLVGGCLSVLSDLCGTEFYPDLSDAILLFEDVGEKTYRIDLMLNQIRLNPNFSKIKGIVFGQFVDAEERHKGDGSVNDVIKEFCKDLKVPVIKDFAYSHSKECYVLPIGKEVVLDASNCRITF